MSTIGFRIKTLRKGLKMNQKDFSKAIGISQGTLSDIENDKSYPAIETILSLFGYIDISADWLLKGTGTCYIHADSNLSQWNDLYNEAPENTRPYLISMVKAFLQTIPNENNPSVKNPSTSTNTDEDAATTENSNIA